MIRPFVYPLPSPMFHPVNADNSDSNAQALAVEVCNLLTRGEDTIESAFTGWNIAAGEVKGVLVAGTRKRARPSTAVNRLGLASVDGRARLRVLTTATTPSSRRKGYMSSIPMVAMILLLWIRLECMRLLTVV